MARLPSQVSRYTCILVVPQLSVDAFVAAIFGVVVEIILSSLILSKSPPVANFLISYFFSFKLRLLWLNISAIYPHVYPVSDFFQICL